MLILCLLFYFLENKSLLEVSECGFCSSFFIVVDFYFFQISLIQL